MKKIICLLLSGTLFGGVAFAQQYDLQKLLTENKLIVTARHIAPLSDDTRKGISTNGIVWLKDVTFSEGTIEVDLRGKDVFQHSFLGIAFHGVDTVTYDAVYFRPFNFRATDPVRKIHAVQYMSPPVFTWFKLRDEHNGVYEKAIEPPPAATDWVHAKIIVNQGSINVYVDGASTPSLTVQKLNDRKDGLIGVWVSDLDGDFANLKITRK